MATNLYIYMYVCAFQVFSINMTAANSALQHEYSI